MAEAPTLNALERVRALLDANNVNDAMSLLRSLGSRSSEVQNAFAVCFLRQGQNDKALSILRSILFPDGGVEMNPAAPEKFKVNFVTALLMSGNLAGGLAHLKEIRNARSPGARQLLAGVAAWKKKAGFVKSTLMPLFGSLTGQPVRFDFAPGEV